MLSAQLRGHKHRVDFGYASWGASTTAAQSRLGVYRSDLHNGRLPLINIQLPGRLVFFKAISNQQYEARSNFRGGLR